MAIVDDLNFGFSRRLPVVLQTEAAECGVACLTMLAGFFGMQTDLAELRRKFGISLKGATLNDIVSVADSIGLASRPLRVEMGELSMLQTPCILHWDMNHFVVLRNVAQDSITIHDPAVGVRKLSNTEVSRHFTGVAVELTPTHGFTQSEKPPRVRLRDMLGRFSGVKRSLLQLLVIAFALEIFAITSPLFMQWVVDHALVSADQDLLTILVVGFTLLLLIRTSVATMRGWMLMVLGASLKVQARTNLFSHLLNLPAPFFQARHLGDIVSRFGSQDTILKAITTELIEVVLDGVMVVFTLLIMVLYAPTLAILVVAGAFVYAFLKWVSYVPIRQASAEAIVWSAKRDTHFLESLRGITTIKLFNAQERRRVHWTYLLVETVNRQLTTQKLRLLLRTLKSLILGGLTILVIWFGTNRVMQNTMSIGMLLAFIAYKDQFLGRISALIERFVDLQMLNIHTERLADIALTKPEQRHWHGNQNLDRSPLAISVCDLKFRYGENEPFVLNGLNFDIKAGESVAIAGPSGCGKTTLVKLLAGLLTPSEGHIIVNGEPVNAASLERYRSAIGVVMQDDQLFAGSIADNISFFNEVSDLDRIQKCAEEAAIHDDIMAMPMGYHSLIGDMGTILSGGQKQRVLLARAFYHQPSLLLLDEATSHLDLARERSVNEAISRKLVTRIIVAHRGETLHSADRLISLEAGRVVNLQKQLA